MSGVNQVTFYLFNAKLINDFVQGAYLQQFIKEDRPPPCAIAITRIIVILIIAISRIAIHVLNRVAAVKVRLTRFGNKTNIK